jgi:hypothetical protein
MKYRHAIWPVREDRGLAIELWDADAHDRGHIHPGSVAHQVFADIIAHFFDTVYMDLCERNFDIDGQEGRYPMPVTSPLVDDPLFGPMTSSFWTQNCLPGGAQFLMSARDNRHPLKAANPVKGTTWKLREDVPGKLGFIGHPSAPSELQRTIQFEVLCKASPMNEGAIVKMYYLRSYENMGMARVTLSSSGGHEEGVLHHVTLDGLWDERVSLPDELELDVPTGSYLLSVTVLTPEEIVSGSLNTTDRDVKKSADANKFKILALSCCSS